MKRGRPAYRIQFGEQVRIARALKFSSQEEAADALGVDRTTLSKWESGSHKISKASLDRIESVLGLSHDAIANYLVESNKKELFVGGTFDFWMREGKSLSELLEGAYSVMDEWPPAEIEDPAQGSNEFGENQKWDQFAEDYPMGCYAVMDRTEDEMVGFWQVLSIKDDLYERGRIGENINLEMQHSHLSGFFIPNVDHSLYFVDCFIRKLYLRTAVGRKLFEGFLEFLEELALNDQYVTRILAHASELASERLCDDANFVEICEHSCHRRDSEDGPVPTKLYELDMSRGGDNAFFRNSQMLFEKYRDRYRFDH